MAGQWVSYAGKYNFGLTCPVGKCSKTLMSCPVSLFYRVKPVLGGHILKKQTDFLRLAISALKCRFDHQVEPVLKPSLPNGTPTWRGWWFYLKSWLLEQFYCSLSVRECQDLPGMVTLRVVLFYMHIHMLYKYIFRATSTCLGDSPIFWPRHTIVYITYTFASIGQVIWLTGQAWVLVQLFHTALFGQSVNLVVQCSPQPGNQGLLGWNMTIAMSSGLIVVSCGLIE